MHEGLSYGEETHETQNEFGMDDEFFQAELAFPKLDGVLFPLVVEHADVVAPCDWMGGAEVCLSEALNNYPVQMTEEVADSVIADVQAFLANRVIALEAKDEKDEQTTPVEEIVPPEPKQETPAVPEKPRDLPVDKAEEKPRPTSKPAEQSAEATPLPDRVEPPMANHMQKERSAAPAEKAQPVPIENRNEAIKPRHNPVQPVEPPAVKMDEKPIDVSATPHASVLASAEATLPDDNPRPVIDEPFVANENETTQATPASPTIDIIESSFRYEEVMDQAEDEPVLEAADVVANPETTLVMGETTGYDSTEELFEPTGDYAAGTEDILGATEIQTETGDTIGFLEAPEPEDDTTIMSVLDDGLSDGSWSLSEEEVKFETEESDPERLEAEALVSELIYEANELSEAGGEEENGSLLQIDAKSLELSDEIFYTDEEETVVQRAVTLAPLLEVEYDEIDDGDDSSLTAPLRRGTMSASVVSLHRTVAQAIRIGRSVLYSLG